MQQESRPRLVLLVVLLGGGTEYTVFAAESSDRMGWACAGVGSLLYIALLVQQLQLVSSVFGELGFSFRPGQLVSIICGKYKGPNSAKVLAQLDKNGRCSFALPVVLFTSIFSRRLLQTFSARIRVCRASGTL